MKCLVRLLRIITAGPVAAAFARPTLVRPAGAARPLSEAIRRSGAIAMEAWLRQENMKQIGPARAQVQREMISRIGPP